MRCPIHLQPNNLRVTAYRNYVLNFNQVPEYYTFIFKDFKNGFN